MSEPRCPLCSDGQECYPNPDECYCDQCRLPVEHWPAVQALKDRVGHLERETESLGRVLYETDKLMEHFTDDKLLIGTGQWRQRELYDHCKRIHDAMESAKDVILEDFDAMNGRES